MLPFKDRIVTAIGNNDSLNQADLGSWAEGYIPGQPDRRFGFNPALLSEMESILKEQPD